MQLGYLAFMKFNPRTNASFFATTVTYRDDAIKLKYTSKNNRRDVARLKALVWTGISLAVQAELVMNTASDFAGVCPSHPVPLAPYILTAMEGNVIDYGSTCVQWTRHRQPRYKGGSDLEGERPTPSYIVDVCIRTIQHNTNSAPVLQ